jgi:glycosyltransferase involved in cell wall biosynthesis
MKAQKIVVISFDHWNYDGFIVKQLQELGHEATHIKIGNFKHKNFFVRLKNTYSKVILQKNPKHFKRQEYIIKRLQNLGQQDQILVLNPDLIDKKYHEKISLFTNKYIAYLYDSVARCNVLHLLDGIFDEIYSFDKNDIQKYQLKSTQNFNYLNKNDYQNGKVKQELIYIASIDERLEKMIAVTKHLIQNKITFKCIIVGKKTWKYQIKQKLFRLMKKNHPIINKQIIFRSKRINSIELLKLYQESNVLLDLVRKNQTGLSFRIFEAMAMNKKIITSNISVFDYDFYNETNYLVLDENFKEINNFIMKPYQKMDNKVYYHYTIENWVKNVFEI